MSPSLHLVLCLILPFLKADMEKQEYSKAAWQTALRLRVRCLFYGNNFDIASSSFSCSVHECICVLRAGGIGFRTGHPKYAEIAWQNHSELGKMSFSQLASVIEWVETTEGCGVMLTSLMVRLDHWGFSCFCGESGAEQCHCFYFSSHEMEPVDLIGRERWLHPHLLH